MLQQRVAVVTILVSVALLSMISDFYSGNSSKRRRKHQQSSNSGAIDSDTNGDELNSKTQDMRPSRSSPLVQRSSLADETPSHSPSSIVRHASSPSVRRKGSSSLNFSSFPAVDATAIAALLDPRRISACIGSQNILLIGHSHVRDVFCSFGHYTNLDQCTKKCLSPLPLLAPAAATAAIGTVVYERETYLSNSEGAKIKYLGRSNSIPGFDVIIPGRGAWDLAYNSTDEEEFRQTYATALKGLVEMLNRNNPDARVIIYLLHYFHPPTKPAFKVCTTEKRVAAYREQTIRAAAEVAEWAKRKFPDFKAPVQLFDVYKYTKQLPRSAADGWGHHFRPGGAAAAVIADSLMKDGICPTRENLSENAGGLPKGTTVIKDDPLNGEGGSNDNDGATTTTTTSSSSASSASILPGLHSCMCQQWRYHASCTTSWGKIREHGSFYKKGDNLAAAFEVCTEFSASRLSADDYRYQMTKDIVVRAGKPPPVATPSSPTWSTLLNSPFSSSRTDEALMLSGIHSSYPGDPSLYRWSAVAPLQYATLIRLLCSSPTSPKPVPQLGDSPIGQCLKVMGRTANVTDNLFEPFPFEWVVERMSRTGKAPPCLCTSSGRSLVFEKGLQEFKKSHSRHSQDDDDGDSAERSLPRTLQQGGWERMIASQCEQEAEDWRKVTERKPNAGICWLRGKPPSCWSNLQEALKPYLTVASEARRE